MDYREELRVENETVMDRYDLSMERIAAFVTEESVPEPYRDYFRNVAGFIGMIRETVTKLADGTLADADLETLKQLNFRLYGDVLPENYGTSYANPAYAVEKLGDGYGQLLSFLYSEIRGDIVFAYENRLFDITILNEMLIEIYNQFESEDGIPQIADVKESLYWFTSDYADRTVTYRVREGLDPSLSFARDIIMKEDLSDLRYLYRFGEYISDSELKVAEFLSSLPEETINNMADTYTEGYRKGFEVMGRDLTKKHTVVIRYEVGFERMIRRAVENFEKLGLETVFIRAAVQSVNKNPSRKVGYYSSSPNKQYDYDHRYDSAVYMGKAFKDRKVAVLKVAYEEYKKLAADYAGPAVVETFGQEAFHPVNKKEAYALSPKQQQLSITYSSESMQIINEFIPGDETSFTIIAWPLPAIGEHFEEIFKETIAINTLDYEVYKTIQQVIIDTLDQASAVHIKGKGENETDLTVTLHTLKNPEKETNFENCVADVNIPLGEVFTSPVLEKTSGLLHVGSVYIGDIQFKNLKMQFEDGKVTEYSCENFEDAEESRKLIRQLILKNHDSLPMGEFAIGTNTTAYAMAQKFGILDKLPILIVEKMGPHFAVGDTCYSWSEDSAVYNPNGKEIIARDNEISLLRKEDPGKAYFGCHTDITIPYAELDYIETICDGKDGVRIIDDGRFVLAGVEELNRPLEQD